MKRPKIYPQSERSYHCGACATATVLNWFGEEPDPIPVLYAALRAEHAGTQHYDHGMYLEDVQSWFLRRDWLAIASRTGGPYERKDGDEWYRSHDRDHQRIATWRVINGMLKDGYLCMLDFYTVAKTRHFAVVYDAFVRKNTHWLRIACSAQGYMELQAQTFLTRDSESTAQLFVKPANLELR